MAVIDAPPQAPPPDRRADVVYVLVLMQCGFLLLAGLGEALLMGANGAYLLLPVLKLILLLWLATKVVSGRRWAVITMIVVQGVTVLGFWLQLGLGLLPFVDFTVNLVGLLTNLALPLGLIWLCGALLYARLLARRAAQLAQSRELAWHGELALLAPACDPYPEATLVEEAYR